VVKTWLSFTSRHSAPVDYLHQPTKLGGYVLFVRLFVCLSVRQSAGLCKSSTVGFVMIGPRNGKNQLPFGGDTVVDVDPHHISISSASQNGIFGDLLAYLWLPV